MIAFLSWVLAWFALASDEPLAVHHGRVAADDPVITTEALERSVAPAFPVRGPTLEFEAPANGVYRFELSSYEFKPYLVVRDAANTVLGEDEFGRSGILPRVTLELTAGARCRLEAGSRHGQPGAFELAIFAGAAPPADPAAERAAGLAFARDGLAQLETAAGEPDPGRDAALGTALHRLAYASIFTGDVEGGVALLRRALEVRERALGDHPLTAETCASLGSVLQQTGDVAGARPLFERALAIDEQVYGADHAVTAGALRSAGAVAEMLEDRIQAVTYYQRALPVLDARIGPDSPESVFVVARLARLAHVAQDFARAELLYERELASRERIAGGRDPESATVLEALAALHEARGDAAGARGLLESALARREATVGPKHPDTAGTLAHLGVLLKAQGEVDRGDALVQRAVAIDPNVYVPELVRQADSVGLWNDRTTRLWQLVWVVLAGVLFAWSGARKRAGRPIPKAWLVGSVLISLATYVNFGAFHFGSFVHRWDTFHYYIGAKYFDELRYDGLYDGVVLADAEAPGWAERNATRLVRDLRTNQIVGTQALLADPGAFKRRFTPERWAEFKADVAHFRDREDAARWEQTTTDHGYNATPVWGILGHALASLVPPSDAGLAWLGSIDLAYLAALAAVLVWGFGLEVAALALAVLATFFPARFAWTGGGLLRWDWLFFAAAAVACLRKDRPWLGGFALGYATLLRVFPVFVFVGPLLLWVLGRVRGDREHSATLLRFFGGAALAGLVLVPVSFVTSGGPSAWTQFAANSAKHQATPLSNHMGLPTVLAWHAEPAARTTATRDDSAFWDRWRAARTEARDSRRTIQVVIAIAWIVLLGFAVRGRTAAGVEPWLAAALSVTLIPVAVELTCYYFGFVVVLATVVARRPRVAGTLLLLCALSLVISLALLPGMTEWEDRQFTQLSVLSLAAFALVLLTFVRGERAVSSAA